MRSWETKLQWLCFNSIALSREQRNKKIPLLIPSVTRGRLGLEAAPSLGSGRRTNWQKHKPAMSPWLALLALGYRKVMLAAVLLWESEVVTPAGSTAPGEALLLPLPWPESTSLAPQSCLCSFHPAWLSPSVVLTRLTSGVTQFSQQRIPHQLQYFPLPESRSRGRDTVSTRETLTSLLHRNAC